MEAVLNLDVGTVTCTTDETDAEGKVARVFADKTIPAADTLPGGSTAAQDLSCQTVAPGALRYKEISSPFPDSSVTMNPYGPSYEVIRELSNISGVSTNSKAYWDEPNKPEFTETKQILHYDPPAPPTIIYTHAIPLFRDAAITADVSAPTLSVKTTMREPLKVSADQGLYQAEAVALRHGCFAYISYPGRDVTLNGTEFKAMDLSITTVNSVETGDMYADIDTDLKVPQSGGGVNILSMTLALGWALGVLVPGAGIGGVTAATLVSAAFGASGILYDASQPLNANHQTGESYAIYTCFIVKPSDNVLDRVLRSSLVGSQLAGIIDRHNDDTSFPASGTRTFRNVPVGSCVGAFFEASASVGLKSQDTWFQLLNPDDVNQTTVTAQATITVTGSGLGMVLPTH